VINKPVLNFTNNEAWYDVKLLRGNGEVTEAISYETHKRYISEAFTNLGLLNCRKVTHAARGSGAREAEMAGVPSDSIKRLGGWKQTLGAMEESYLANLPYDAMRAMAGFAINGNMYTVQRDAVVPTCCSSRINISTDPELVREAS